jgi:hypothetical protein
VARSPLRASTGSPLPQFPTSSLQPRRPPTTPLHKQPLVTNVIDLDPDFDYTPPPRASVDVEVMDLDPDSD